jgi:tetratricopeptide (TPR) repeat protein
MKKKRTALRDYIKRIFRHSATELSEVTSLFDQGLALHQAGRLVEAEKIYRKILAAQPNHFDSIHLLGAIFCQRGNHTQALHQINLALKTKPSSSLALNSRGVALKELKRFEEALASFNRALTLRPDYAQAYSNRGATLHELKRFEEALTSFDRALALQPDYAEALFNRGATLHELQRLEEALASYDRALTLRPNDVKTHYNQATCRLLIGDFDRGWKQHEWRWETESNQKRNFAAPLWTGREDLAGKTILLHAEQGLGDTIQFCRYAPLVAARGARVILEVQKPLHALMRSLPGAAQILSQNDPLPRFDFHCPLLSLPLAFGTRVETIPSAIPYLAAPEAKMQAWRDRLGTHHKPRIGLVWAGNPRIGLPNANRIDRQRSIAVDRLTPIFQITDYEFYSLQKGDEAVAQLRSSPLRQQVIDWTDELYDFSDTAALIANLDLIISVDTSVAHLAGALGKPFWLMNRYNTCWRWLLGRNDSPWYPTARLFRQDQTRNWDGVIAHIQEALRD